MKYMIMMFGDAAAMAEARSTDWITEMIGFMHALNTELTDSGEMVEARGLVDSTQAKTVTVVDDVPVVTDGPFAESKESLVGYWVLDVEDEARALAIASRISAWAQIVEVRQVMDAPPDME